MMGIWKESGPKSAAQGRIKRYASIGKLEKRRSKFRKQFNVGSLASHKHGVHMRMGCHGIYESNIVCVDNREQFGCTRPE